jgi:hypothetical protein
MQQDIAHVENDGAQHTAFLTLATIQVLIALATMVWYSMSGTCDRHDRVSRRASSVDGSRGDIPRRALGVVTQRFAQG